MSIFVLPPGTEFSSRRIRVAVFALVAGTLGAVGLVAYGFGAWLLSSPEPPTGPCREYAQAVSMGSSREVDCPRPEHAITIDRATWGADLVVCRCPSGVADGGAP